MATRRTRVRKKYIRAQVSAGEKAICLILLVMLPAAAGLVYRAGQRYDPRLFALDPALAQAASRRAPPLPATLAEPGEDLAGSMRAAPVSGSSPTSTAGGYALPGFLPSGSAPGMPPPLLPPMPGAPITPLPSEQQPAYSHQATAARSAFSAASQILPASWGDPAWSMTSPAQHFRPDNLYEKIDGRAEQYLQYGASGLDTATYANRRDASRFLDAFVYDMSTPSNAFGIFSLERPQGAKPVALGEQGYRADASYFFIRGRHYIQIVASERGRALEEAGLKLARLIDAALGSGLRTAGAPKSGRAAMSEGTRAPGKAGPPLATEGPARRAPLPRQVQPPANAPGAGAAGGQREGKSAARPSSPEAAARDLFSPDAILSLFPKEDRVPDTFRYLPKDALGLDFLTEVYTMRYRVEEKEFTLFLTRRQSEAEARALVDRYVEFLGQFGRLVDRQAEERVSFLVGEVSGYLDAVFRAGPFLGGVSGATDRRTAMDLALRLLRSAASGAPGLVPPGARTMERWPSAPAGSENR